MTTRLAFTQQAIPSGQVRGAKLIGIKHVSLFKWQVNVHFTI